MLTNVLVFIISVILADAIYIFYKRYLGISPTGVKLVFVLAPILGSLISIFMYNNQDIMVILRGFILITIIIILIPINVLCLKNGTHMTINSAKETFKAGRDLYKEQKAQNKKFKETLEKQRKEKDDE